MATLSGNPGAPFQNQIRGLETTDPVHPGSTNPTLQDLINNDAGLNFRLGVLESVGAAGRLASLEGFRSTIDPDNDGKVNSAVMADQVPWAGVIGAPSSLPPAVYGVNVNPPITAPPGSIWFRSALTLIKVSAINSTPAIWRANQPVTIDLGAGFADPYPGDVYSEYTIPASLQGLTIAQGIPLHVQAWHRHQGGQDRYMACFYRVPATATPTGTKEPSDTSGATVVAQVNNEGDTYNRVKNFFYNADTLPPIEPGKKLWVKVGRAYNGINYSESEAYLRVVLVYEFQQTAFGS